MTVEPQDDFLVLSQISKRYGGVHALENVDFRCGRGKIHAVLGENGAGKSTLIKIVAGVVQPDTGSISFDGLVRHFAGPADAAAAGVVCIFQELSLMPDLSVADNISIAAPPRRFGLIDARAQRRRAEALLADAGCEDVNPLLRVRDLPLSRRQMVEIAKALGQRPQLLILDEATSALTSADVEKVYALLARLKSQNVAILYISHRMHEVEALADRASVFRNGRHVETFDMGARSTAEIVQLMIGRDIATQYPPKPIGARPAAALKVERLGWEDRLKDISIEVGAGEVVGVGGLDGQGQKTLLLALFGVLRGVTGTIAVSGRVVRPGSPGHAKTREIGIALVPEDRKTEGLMLPMSVADNLTIASLSALSVGPFIDAGKEAQAVEAGLQAAQDQDRCDVRSGFDIVGWKPAEGCHRQVADDRTAHHPAQRSDARHRRRHQTGTLPADARACRPGVCYPVLFDRLRRTDRLLRPCRHHVRWTHRARTRWRRSKRDQHRSQFAQHRRRPRIWRRPRGDLCLATSRSEFDKTSLS